MAVIYEVVYESQVVSVDIPKLPRALKERIRSAIEEKLTTHPDVYGKPLRRSLKGYRKLRVGDYRVVFRIDSSKIKVFAILHRSVVYAIMERQGGSS
ncbi:MAG: type II toxin-antitoxin system RelE/ParE family toxin [Patescibacteria group bacterium]